MAQIQNTYGIKLTKGMNRDQGIQTFNPSTAYKLLNIKNQIIGTALLDSLTNEKGTSLSTIYYNTAKNANDEYSVNIQNLLENGTIIAVFKCTPQFSLIFTRNIVEITEDETTVTKTFNCIFKIQQEQENYGIIVTLLAYGQFNFGDYIDAVFCYENSELQKAYWVDGINTLRYINTDKKETDASYITDSFYLDSSPQASYNHLIKVTKRYTQGIFSAGVIQYAFTYYIKNGPETGIIDYTPLYYITNAKRGLKEDETTSCSFEVKIINPDKRFDYIRLYAIQRTSLNGTPIARLVKDIKINKDE